MRYILLRCAEFSMVLSKLQLKRAKWYRSTDPKRSLECSRRSRIHAERAEVLIS